MANGRMITNAITKDKKVNDLSCDASRLAFTWLITFADCEGRVNGDPAIVKSLVFPRRKDITSDMVEAYIIEWAIAGLVYWYELEDDLWICFPSFDKNQSGLRKDREAPSRVPAPPKDNKYHILLSEELRTKYGVSPEELPVKLKEVKLKEENRRSAPPNDDMVYLSIWTGVTGMLAYPNKERENIPYTIQAIYTQYKDGTADYLKPFYDDWRERGYSKTNPGWLDWALANQTPKNKDNVSKNGQPYYIDTSFGTREFFDAGGKFIRRENLEDIEVTNES